MRIWPNFYYFQPQKFIPIIYGESLTYGALKTAGQNIEKKSVKLAWFFSHSIFYCWSLYSPLVVGVLGVSTGVSRVFNKKNSGKVFQIFLTRFEEGKTQYLVIICLGSWYSTIWHTFVQVFLTYPPVHWKTLDCNFAPTVC